MDTSDTARSLSPYHNTWTSSVGANESRPINFVNWYESAAFCIWDGGFLASEAEWEYAAAGGALERYYPWGSSTPDCTYANFFYYETDDGYSCELAAQVGKRSPKGDGLYGQSDLAGNVDEWTLDWHATPYSATCANCSNLTGTSSRVIRGGGWGDYESALAAADHGFGSAPTHRSDGIGFRCARTP